MSIYIIFILLLFLFMLLDSIILSNKKSINYYITSYSQTNKFNIIIKIAILLIIIFSSIRYDVGWDYMAYYETISISRVTNILLKNEHLTILLLQIASWLREPQLFFMFNSILTICLIMSIVKVYSKDYWISIMFFIAFPLFYLNSFSVIRNFTAIAITFYGFKFIENRNLMKYIICVLLASFIHKSAIITIVFYFVYNIKIKNIIYILGMILAPFVSNLINRVVILYFPHYAVYTNITSKQEGTKAIIVFLFIGIVAILLKNKLDLQSSIFNKYFNLFYIGLIIYITFIRQGTMGHRLSLYGTIYSLIILPDLINLFNKKRDRILIKFVFCVLCIAMFFFTILVGKETYIPYKTFFNK